MATPPPPPPPELVDDLVEEILLRCSLADPARLLRASLVCKSWRRLVSSRRFRRRFAERHRTPPLLGFLYQHRSPAVFEPAMLLSSFSPRSFDRSTWRALDARHGRVLAQNLVSSRPEGTELVVWNPVTDGMHRLPVPRFLRIRHRWTTGVVCAVAGCDHLHCGGRFRVALVVTSEDFAYSCVYSSETGAWSKLTHVRHYYDHVDHQKPGVHVGTSLYFLSGHRVLQYDVLGTRQLSTIEIPSTFPEPLLTTSADGARLGLATVYRSRLYLWSWKACPGRDAGWVQDDVVIDLEASLPVRDLSAPPPRVVGFAEGAGVILVRVVDVFFAIDVKSGLVTKIGKGSRCFDVIPYVNFYTPVLRAASSGGRPRANASKTKAAHLAS